METVPLDIHRFKSEKVASVSEECCMAFADIQWLFYSGEQIVAHGPLLVSFSYLAK